MSVNYLEQLRKNYPDKSTVLEWIKPALDGRVYYYGEHFKYPEEPKRLKQKIRRCLARKYHTLLASKQSYDGAVVSNAYFNINTYLKNVGYKVMLPPWKTGRLTTTAMQTIRMIDDSDFNVLISDVFIKRVLDLKDELREFYSKNKTPFVILSNGVTPVNRLTIEACKEIGIKTSIYLHGFPAYYDPIENLSADYLFVWGEKIKTNYEQYSHNSNIVVTGHPLFSSFIFEDNHSNNDIVVLSRSINGVPWASSGHVVQDRGVCIQHIYIVEEVLKRNGYSKAILRLHPSENPQWYKKYIDPDFYTIDTHNLETTLKTAKFVVGPISTVILNTVLNKIPYYPFIIGPSYNSYVEEVPPPFREEDGLPISYTGGELLKRIQQSEYLTKEHLNGYVNPQFDVNKITSCIV